MKLSIKEVSDILNGGNDDWEEVDWDITYSGEWYNTWEYVYRKVSDDSFYMLEVDRSEKYGIHCEKYGYDWEDEADDVFYIPVKVKKVTKTIETFEVIYEQR